VNKYEIIAKEWQATRQLTDTQIKKFEQSMMERNPYNDTERVEYLVSEIFYMAGDNHPKQEVFAHLDRMYENCLSK